MSEVHPRMVAKDFGVHLRTVFRWISRGYLTSIDGRVVRNYSDGLLDDWRRTCYLWDARRELKISVGTLRSWRKKGLVKTVKILGFERVSLSWIEEVKKRRKIGTFSIHHPDYGVPQKLLIITGVGQKKLTECLDQGLIPSRMIEGRRMIPTVELDKIENEWRSSCKIIEAARLLETPRATVRTWLDNGRLECVTILGKRRALLSSIAKLQGDGRGVSSHRAAERSKYRKRKNAGKLAYHRKQAHADSDNGKVRRATRSASHRLLTPHSRLQEGVQAGNESFSIEVKGTTARSPAGEVIGNRNRTKGTIPVLSCEGACIRGEIARLAANRVAKEDAYGRACHGELLSAPGSATSAWVQGAERVVVIDGCVLHCNERMLEHVVGREKLVHFDAQSHYKKYTDLFDIDSVPAAERSEVGRDVAEWVLANLRD